MWYPSHERYIISNVESQDFTPYNFGSTVGNRTPDLCNTRSTCLLTRPWLIMRLLLSAIGCTCCLSWRRKEPWLVIAGPTAVSSQALHPPPDVASQCPAPGRSHSLFQALLHPVSRQAQATSYPGAAELESVFGSATLLFQAACG